MRPASRTELREGPLNQTDFTVVQPGERTNPAGKAISNRILLRIPDEEFDLVRPHLAFLDLPNHMTLHEPDESLEFAYFPNRGLISIVVAMKGERTVEAGLAGCEGSVGTPLAVGLKMCPLRHVVQIDGDGFRMEGAALQQILASTPLFRFALARFAVIQGMQIAQTAACNRLHETKQRLARWLLMAQDRVDQGWLRITHDFLATMLGTDRSSVSLAAGELQEKGIIEYARGAVRVLHRKKLEEAACECYQVIQQFNGELGLK